METDIRTTLEALLDDIAQGRGEAVVPAMEKLDDYVQASRTQLHPQLVHFLFNFPELLLVILTLCLAIGSYSGYRLSEVLRFRDLAKVDP